MVKIEPKLAWRNSRKSPVTSNRTMWSGRCWQFVSPWRWLLISNWDVPLHMKIKRIRWASFLVNFSFISKKKQVIDVIFLSKRKLRTFNQVFIKHTSASYFSWNSYIRTWCNNQSFYIPSVLKKSCLKS